MERIASGVDEKNSREDGGRNRFMCQEDGGSQYDEPAMMDASLLLDLLWVDKSGIKGGVPTRRNRRYPYVALWGASRLYNLLY